jgi:hypothetical protein
MAKVTGKKTKTIKEEKKEKKKKARSFIVVGSKDATPMSKERFIDKLKSENPPGSKDISEIRPMDTLTSKGPGKLKLAKKKYSNEYKKKK